MAGVAINLCGVFSSRYIPLHLKVIFTFYKCKKNSQMDSEYMQEEKKIREVCVTVGLSSEVYLPPTSKISKTQYFLIICAYKHIILGIINTTIFFVCDKFYTNLGFMKSGKKYQGSPKFQKSQIFRGPPKFRIFTKIEDLIF